MKGISLFDSHDVSLTGAAWRVRERRDQLIHPPYQKPELMATAPNVLADQIGPTAVKATKPEGALWFVYPKRTGSIKTDIRRDVGWGALYDLRYRPVTQIAIDETWTGFRFRPKELVKKR